MRRILLALALAASAAAAPAFAEGELSCADFAMLDDAGKAAAMTPAEGGMMAGSDAGGMMAGQDDVAMATAACAAHPDLAVGAAMQAMH